MNSEFQATLRRLKPEKHRAQLKPRPESDLTFIETTSKKPRKLLYDTTVYIDIRIEAELAAATGLLDPAHSETREIVEQIVAVIERRPTYRTIVPDPEIWREGGILSGILARLQGYGREHRRRALNDALLFATARKHGCVVLTRNVVDFDLLQQLDPSGSVLFYK